MTLALGRRQFRVGAQLLFRFLVLWRPLLDHPAHEDCASDFPHLLREHAERLVDGVVSLPVARLTFFKELETKIRNLSIVGLAAPEATPHDAWENLVQIIQETAGPFLHQGAPRPTRPLALERRRLLLELGTARRLTGSSGDQSLVETTKTEITRVCDAFLVGPREDEGQCSLRNWKKASENRSLSQFTDSHVSSLAQALGRNTVVFGQIRAYTPSQIEASGTPGPW